METREDEEQNVKLTEILELLVAAGYFRARIKGLSPFDKVRESLADQEAIPQRTAWLTKVVEGEVIVFLLPLYP